MRVVPVSGERPDPAVLAEAAELLRRGELVAFPTETVYGLGANALDAAAVDRLYRAKGRPAWNPLIVHVPDAAAARALAAAWPAAAARLAERWWPGPLTVVLPKQPIVPDNVTAGLPTVALRVPRHPVALALLRAAGVPVAAPSANRSGEVSPTTAAHVARSLGDLVPLVLDAGPTEVGIESTVVDLSGARPRVLRPGGIGRAELEAVLGPLERAPQAPDPDAPRPAPGMLERHYAPRARLFLFPPESAAIVATEASALARQGETVGALLRQATVPVAGRTVVLPEDPAGYARELYRALHELDDAGCSVIMVEEPPSGPAWEAVRDRLERAARR